MIVFFLIVRLQTSQGTKKPDAFPRIELPHLRQRCPQKWPIGRTAGATVHKIFAT